MPEATPSAEYYCPVCGGLNQCRPAQQGTFDSQCWCTTAGISREALDRIPEDQRGKACLCPRCAAGLLPPAP